VIDGGNSFYRDDMTRATQLSERGLHYVDCGTSGGVWGLERGYSLMIGGEDDVVARLDPIFRSIAPGEDGTAKTPGRTRSDGTAPLGYCTVDRTVPDTSSRWCTTASSTE